MTLQHKFCKHTLSTIAIAYLFLLINNNLNIFFYIIECRTQILTTHPTHIFIQNIKRVPNKAFPEWKKNKGKKRYYFSFQYILLS